MIPLDPPLAAAAAAFGLAPSDLVKIPGGTFAHVYLYSAGDREQVLRVSPPGPDVDPASTRSMLAWQRFLAKQGACVPSPIHSVRGNLVEEIKPDGTAADEGKTWVVTSFERARGLTAEDLPAGAWNDDLLRLLGSTLGRCHRIAREYVPQSESLRRPDWQSAANCFHPVEALPTAEALVRERRAEVLARLSDLARTPDTWGLAHLDLHFANFIVDAGRPRIVLIDFDDCGYGWYAMDLAMLAFDALVVYDEAGPAFCARLIEQVLRGYLNESRIERAPFARVPEFLKLLEVGVYAMLAGSYDPDTAQGWVRKFMRGRRERIREGTPYSPIDLDAIYERVVL